VKVSGLNLATPDARHRRPLKFLLYHQSVKRQRTAQARTPQLDSFCIPLQLGAFIRHFVLRKSRNEVPAIRTSGLNRGTVSPANASSCSGQKPIVRPWSLLCRLCCSTRQTAFGSCFKLRAGVAISTSPGCVGTRSLVMPSAIAPVRRMSRHSGSG
jgi:hypothetical protein